MTHFNTIKTLKKHTAVCVCCSVTAEHITSFPYLCEIFWRYLRHLSIRDPVTRQLNSRVPHRSNTSFLMCSSAFPDARVFTAGSAGRYNQTLFTKNLSEWRYCFTDTSYSVTAFLSSTVVWVQQHAGRSCVFVLLHPRTYIMQKGILVSLNQSSTVNFPQVKIQVYTLE